MRSLRKILYLLLFLPQFAQAQIITSIAGNGSMTDTGDGGPATAAGIYFPCGGAFDKQGNYYFGTGWGGGAKVRKISPSGFIYTIAGTISGFFGDGGPATAAQIGNVQAVALDTVGNIYIADSYNNRIRKIDIFSGIISTIAGNGTPGYGGDGGPATAAMLYDPLDVCYYNGNLYIADYDNLRVRKINSLGVISTVAGNGSFFYGGDGGLADTTSIQGPSGLCTDNDGNLYIADWYSRVMKINSAGIITTVVGNGIGGYSGDGGPATAASTVPYKVAVDQPGNLYIAEYGYNKVRVVNSSGMINLLAGTGVAGFYGDGGPATNAQINHPSGVAIDSCGNLYIADSRNFYVRKVILPGPCNPITERVNSAYAKDILSVYPNPANEKITVTSGSSISNVTIIDLLGKAQFNRHFNSQTAEIDISGLSPGIYFISVTNNNGLKTVKKFIKN